MDTCQFMHENTDYHKDAVLQSLKLCEGVEHPERTLPYQISQANKQLYDTNFHILKAIVKVIWETKYCSAWA